MSQKLINRSQDLKKLINEGYNLQLDGGIALINEVPYVNSNKEIKYGTLVSELNLSGNKTIKPNTHVINFIGEHPCDKNGKELKGIKHQTKEKKLANGITVNHSFSNKPQNGYNNYYDKFTRYIEMISAPAKSIDDSVTAKTFKKNQIESTSVFHYLDTNSTRAEINKINEKIKGQRIGIIGLGGTGSYLLDFVAKTPASEIHIFDGDIFYQHNAFRAPGAPSIEKLEKKINKAIYFKSIYSNMHKNIFSHPEYMKKSTLNKLKDLDFIFICIDKGKIKKTIIDYLKKNKQSFIDLGIGIEKVDDSLIGVIRLTLGNPDQYNHLNNRISFAESDNDEYSTNIQISELNALNAILGIIKWKKTLGFYQDLNREFYTTYTINTGEINNEDRP